MMSFILPVRVYLEDTDAQGLVYNASYFRVFERARTEWLRVQGIDHVNLRESAGVSLVLTGIEASFRVPARLDDQLHVSAELARVSGVHFIIKHIARRQYPKKKLLCGAVAQVASVDVETGKPRRLPRNLVADLKINEPEV